MEQKQMIYAYPKNGVHAQGTNVMAQIRWAKENNMTWDPYKLDNNPSLPNYLECVNSGSYFFDTFLEPLIAQELVEKGIGYIDPPKEERKLSGTIAFEIPHFYTPTPWRVGLKERTIVSDSVQHLDIAGAVGYDAVKHYGGNLICESLSIANAKRIVECVNACAGIEDVSNLKDRITVLSQQKDLLELENTHIKAELKELKEALLVINNAVEKAKGQEL